MTPKSLEDFGVELWAAAYEVGYLQALADEKNGTVLPKHRQLSLEAARQRCRELFKLHGFGETGA